MLKIHSMSLVSISRHLIAAWFCSRNRQTVCSHSKLLNVQDQCPFSHRTGSPFAASKLPLKCKIPEVGREFWKSPTPAQGQQVSMASVQSDFQYLQGWRLHNFSGRPVPGLGHPDRIKKSFCLCLSVISCISICASCPVTGCL